MNKKPVVFAMNTGNIGEPTTLCSVLPGPGNCVCFWRTSRKRCALSSPTMTAGRISTWSVKNRGMIAVPGKLPPNRKNARYEPTSGIESRIE